MNAPLPAGADLLASETFVHNAAAGMDRLAQTQAMSTGVAATTPPPLETAQQTILSWGGYFEALALVCFVVALLWALLWLFRRRGGILPGSGPAMRIESRLALGPKKWLIIARCLDKRLLLGVTDQQVTLLAELDAVEAEPAGAGNALGASFATLLQKARTRLKTEAEPALTLHTDTPELLRDDSRSPRS